VNHRVKLIGDWRHCLDLVRGHTTKWWRSNRWSMVQHNVALQRERNR
jgi:hypothetical protein